ncbi:MAG: hypothetical protein JNM91_14095 [Flavobacteriales bacterium]|nr:hypothetical protein [Flavobacteriales bacterium]
MDPDSRTKGDRTRDGILLGMLGVLSGTALMGGALLIRVPDGSLLGLRISDLGTSLFTDYHWPGQLLFWFFGVGGGIALIANLRKWPSRSLLSMLVGSAQVVWILAQTVLLVRPGPPQALYFVLGIAITALGAYQRNGNRA